MCGVELVPGANAVSLVTSNFLDIIAALAWVTDLKKAQDDVFRYAAYDCASFTLQSYNYAWIELNHVKTEYDSTDDDGVTTYEDDRFLWQTAAPDSPKDVLTTFSGNVFEAWWTGAFQVAYYTDGHMKVTFEPSTDRVSFDATDTTADSADGERPTTIRLTGKNIPRAYNTGLEGTSDKARVYRLSGTAVCDNLTLFDYEYKNDYADYTSWISKCECTPDSTLTILIDYR